MSTDGIAYNHYGIKYVLKRLGDQRRSKGSTHMEGEVERDEEEEEKERMHRGEAHTLMEKEIKGVCVRGMRSRHSERQSETTKAFNHYTYW